MNISVIIPNYNGGKLLSENLPKLLNQLKEYKNGEWELIIVDDGSQDDSLRLIQKFSEVKLYKNPKNMGFSHTVNHGASKASGEILLLINTDVNPESGFLAPLLSHFENKDTFAVGCMDKSIEGDTIVLRGRGTGYWKRGFLNHKKGEIDKSDTLWVSGGSGAFRKSYWDKLGGLNNLFNPFYWEDIDLSYRALKSGYKVFFESKSIVIHEHEKGVIKNKFSSYDIKTIAFRNQFIFTWANLTDFNLIFSHFIWLPYHFVKTLIGNETAFYVGFAKALILLPKILKTRYNNKRLFVKSDKEITYIYS